MENKITLTTSINSSNETLDRFANYYHLKNDDNLFTNFYNKFLDYQTNHKICQFFDHKCKVHSQEEITKYNNLNSPIESNIIILKNTSSLDKKTKINDYVSFSYMPFSQKYLDEYENLSRFGSIIYIDTIHDDILVWHKSGNNIVIQSMVVEGCSYFGHSRNYAVFVNKLT